MTMNVAYNLVLVLNLFVFINVEINAVRNNLNLVAP